MADYQHFGQAVAPDHLGWLAQRITAVIGDGAPAAWAGFVWARSDSTVPGNSLYPAEQRGRPKAA